MNFEEIKGWFDSDKWDIGYLTKEQLKICALSPIKYASQTHGHDFTNDIYFNWVDICNGLVLIRKSPIAFDYTLYDQATVILIKQGLKEDSDWFHVYTNFKEAEILSGRGVRARNSLVYNYKFGFDSKVCVIGFKDLIQNPPKIKRVAGNNFKDDYWNKCIGCDACREVCPVGAIHNNEDVDWLDSVACIEFLNYSDHPRIPSVKKHWHKDVHPEVPKKIVDKITSLEKAMEMGDGKGKSFMAWDRNGYSLSSENIINKDGRVIPIPQCRECQVQAPCSKWGGIYPYEQELNMDTSKKEEEIEMVNYG